MDIVSIVVAVLKDLLVEVVVGLLSFLACGVVRLVRAGKSSRHCPSCGGGRCAPQGSAGPVGGRETTNATARSRVQTHVQVHVDGQVHVEVHVLVSGAGDAPASE
jgi:hypothetical protein